MESKSSSITFRLTPSERNNFKDTIRLRNKISKEIYTHPNKLNMNEVLRSLVRNYIDLGPSFLNDEILELKESNRLLLGMGRNLNQLMMRIHQGKSSADDVTIRYLKEIIYLIITSRNSIEKVTEHNQKRGQIEISE